MEEEKVESNNLIIKIKKNVINQLNNYKDDSNQLKKEKNVNTKNNEIIDYLKALINENKEISLNNINDIKNNILNLKKKLLSLKKPEHQYTKKDLEQNLIKQKIISNTISLYKEECDSIKENIGLLEEEYNICSFQLYNVISMKDNYEEIIKENSKYIFKNLMISYDQNIGQSVSDNLIGEQSQLFLFNNNNNIRVEVYDIKNIQNLPKFSNYIYKILSMHITSLINEINIKALIFSSIEEIFYNFLEKKITCEDFIKKISFNISISDDKIHNFIIISRFELLLKYIVKIFSLDKIINDYMKFINNDYPYNKKKLNEKYKEIRIKVQNSTKEKIQYITQEKEYRKNIECWNKIQAIKNEISENEQKIIIQENNYLLNEKKYKNKIKKLEKINENDDQKTIQNIQQNVKNISAKINKIHNEKNNNSIIETSSYKDLCNITEIKKDMKKKINIYKPIIKSECYVLISNISTGIYFDPLHDYDIRPELKGYNKSLICLDNNNNININFIQIKEEVKIKINVNLIKNIIINQNMKTIIYYLKKYKTKKNNNIRLLLIEENKNDNGLDIDELIKCIYNKYFCLSIALSNDKLINIIFLTYNDFKKWLKILDDFYQNNK